MFQKSGVGDKYVDLPLFGLDLSIETRKIAFVRHVGTDRSDARAVDVLDCPVKLGLPATGDVDERSFFNKAPGGFQPDAATATRDNNNFAIQSQHHLLDFTG